MLLGSIIGVCGIRGFHRCALYTNRGRAVSQSGFAQRFRAALLSGALDIMSRRSDHKLICTGAIATAGGRSLDDGCFLSQGSIARGWKMAQVTWTRGHVDSWSRDFR